LLTLTDTRTPPLLNATYEQIVNKTATNYNVIWWRNLPSEPKQDQIPTFTGVGNTSSHPELQYREQELLNPVTQHKLERQLTPQPQYIYSAITDSQDSLRRQLEFFRTREKKLKANLLVAKRERKKLKDLIAAFEASDIVLRANLAATVNETREAAMMLDRLAAEKDHVIRSTNKDLLAMRAGLQDAEDKITQLDTELRFERKLRIHWTKELDEEVRIRRLYEAEMHRISKKTEHVQVQLDLMDDMLPQSHARRRSLLGAHTPFLTSHAILAVAPDNTGQPPPPPFERAIPNFRTRLLNFITKPRPLSHKSLRQTPERNPHDPTTRRSPGHSRQISAWLDRVSDSAKSWRAWVKTLLETISRLEAERSREAESRERSERCLHEDLAAIKDKLGVTQEELSSIMQELGITQEELASTMQELGITQEELTATKERLCVSQEDVSKANCELHRERETLQVTRAQAVNATRELETCVAKLKEAQDARHAGIDKLREVVELLRQRNADVESLKAESEASKSKHSQAVALSAVLRKRVEVLEAEVKSLRLKPKCEEMHPAHADSPLPCPVDPGSCAFRDYVVLYADTFGYTRSFPYRPQCWA
jgi:chromosome segregation ATPase